MSNIFFTSDLHFWHKKVIKYCNRPYTSLEQMNEHLIRRYNSFVHKDSIVYFLGDISFAGVIKTTGILSRLNGFKVLIKGNHDYKWKDAKWLKMGFNAVCDDYTLYIENYKLQLSHYPYYPTLWEQIKTVVLFQKLRYLDNRLQDKGDWLLHGHVHNSWKIRRKMINVGVDVWNYRPISLFEILKLIRSIENDK